MNAKSAVALLVLCVVGLLAGLYELLFTVEVGSVALAGHGAESLRCYRSGHGLRRAPVPVILLSLALLLLGLMLNSIGVINLAIVLFVLASVILISEEPPVELHVVKAA